MHSFVSINLGSFPIQTKTPLKILKVFNRKYELQNARDDVNCGGKDRSYLFQLNKNINRQYLSLCFDIKNPIDSNCFISTWMQRDMTISVPTAK